MADLYRDSFLEHHFSGGREVLLEDGYEESEVDEIEKSVRKIISSCLEKNYESDEIRVNDICDTLAKGPARGIRVLKFYRAKIKKLLLKYTPIQVRKDLLDFASNSETSDFVLRVGSDYRLCPDAVDWPRSRSQKIGGVAYDIYFGNLYRAYEDLFTAEERHFILESINIADDGTLKVRDLNIIRMLLSRVSQELPKVEVLDNDEYLRKFLPKKILSHLVLAHTQNEDLGFVTVEDGVTKINPFALSSQKIKHEFKIDGVKPWSYFTRVLGQIESVLPEEFSLKGRSDKIQDNRDVYAILRVVFAEMPEVQVMSYADDLVCYFDNVESDDRWKRALHRNSSEVLELDVFSVTNWDVSGLSIQGVQAKDGFIKVYRSLEDDYLPEDKVHIEASIKDHQITDPTAIYRILYPALSGRKDIKLLSLKDHQEKVLFRLRLMLITDFKELDESNEDQNFVFIEGGEITFNSKPSITIGNKGGKDDYKFMLGGANPYRYFYQLYSQLRLARIITKEEALEQGINPDTDSAVRSRKGMMWIMNLIFGEQLSAIEGSSWFKIKGINKENDLDTETQTESDADLTGLDFIDVLKPGEEAFYLVFDQDPEVQVEGVWISKNQDGVLKILNVFDSQGDSDDLDLTELKGILETEGIEFEQAEKSNFWSFVGVEGGKCKDINQDIQQDETEEPAKEGVDEGYIPVENKKGVPLYRSGDKFYIAIKNLPGQYQEVPSSYVRDFCQVEI